MSLYATINNFIAKNAIIFSVAIPILSGLLGSYLSYKFNVGVDKRKEFNSPAEPILFELIEHYERYLINKEFQYFYYNDFEHPNFIKIYRRLNWIKKRN